jgi:restriction system protein
MNNFTFENVIVFIKQFIDPLPINEIINKIYDDLTLYIVFSLIFLIIGFLLEKKRHSRKINIGEAAVMRIISKSFSEKEYHLLNNITLSWKNGSTQIDHILVSRYGIFVIETKHYSGWIFGNPISKKWTQVIYKKKSIFQNPIHQNAIHVNRIKEMLEFLNPNAIHSIIVFTGSAELKTALPENVLYINDLVSYIKSYNEEEMSQNRLEFCIGRIESQRYQISKQTDVQHQEYLRKKHGYLQ